MWKKHTFWIVLFSLLLLASAAALLLFPRLQTGRIARITSEGRLVRQVDLDLVTVPYDLRIETADGYNIIRVEPGRIAVIEADCPDQVCRKTGAVSSPLRPILCLPHRLVIEIAGQAEDPAQADATAGGVS